MRDPERRRDEWRWKRAASLLALVGWIVAGAVVKLVDAGTPWDLVVYFSVAAVVLAAGTVWLVPSARRRP
jgi:peptidoglycan/LPS O-acetylase OafA/YrhL